MNERKTTVEYHQHKMMLQGKGGDDRTEKSSIHNKELMTKNRTLEDIAEESM